MTKLCIWGWETLNMSVCLSAIYVYLYLPIYPSKISFHGLEGSAASELSITEGTQSWELQILRGASRPLWSQLVQWVPGFWVKDVGVRGLCSVLTSLLWFWAVCFYPPFLGKVPWTDILISRSYIQSLRNRRVEWLVLANMAAVCWGQSLDSEVVEAFRTSQPLPLLKASFACQYFLISCCCS